MSGEKTNDTQDDQQDLPLENGGSGSSADEIVNRLQQVLGGGCNLDLEKLVTLAAVELVVVPCNHGYESNPISDVLSTIPTEWTSIRTPKTASTR